MNGHSGTNSGRDGRLGRRAAEPFDARRRDALGDVAVRKGPEGLREGLTTRHIQMIASGGMIGTSLLYGLTAGIKLANSSLLLAYALDGVVIFFVVRAIREMSVHRPSLGSFSHYANDYWSPRAGFMAGWNYWLNYIAMVMTELTVVGQYVQYQFPPAPAWALAAAVLLVITAVNLVGTKALGELELWSSAIKVAAVVGMIVLGLYVIATGVNSNLHLSDPPSDHLFGDGFLTRGATGLLASLVFVMFFFRGIKFIGITAGKIENPQRSVPKAVGQVVYHILIFYVGVSMIVTAVVPQRQISGKLSPFVQIFDSADISVAAHILNSIVLTTALSVYNSGLYFDGRVLYSLARQDNAPKVFMRLPRRGVPCAGVLFSSMMTVVAVAVIYFLPETTFSILMATTLGSSIISWVMILLAHRAFRKRIGPSTADLTFRLPGGLASNNVAPACPVGVFILVAFNPDYRTPVAVMPVWLFILFVAYEGKERSSRLGMPTDWVQESRN